MNNNWVRLTIVLGCVLIQFGCGFAFRSESSVKSLEQGRSNDLARPGSGTSTDNPGTSTDNPMTLTFASLPPLDISIQFCIDKVQLGNVTELASSSANVASIFANIIIDAGGGNDTINGGSGAEDIRGGSGNDIIHGNGGNDTLSGGSGDDFITGGDGDDILRGGTGTDTLDGGPGADTIYADSLDTIISDSDDTVYVNGTLVSSPPPAPRPATKPLVEDVTGEDFVDFDLELDPSGTVITDNFNPLLGNYNKSIIDLSSDCESGYSVVVNNAGDIYRSTKSLKMYFSGELNITSSSAKLEYNIDNILNQLNDVSSDVEMEQVLLDTEGRVRSVTDDIDN